MRIFVGAAALILYWASVDAAWSYEPLVNYQLHCMGCHLADGSGQPGRVPSLRRSLLLFSASPQGRDYIVRVPGVAQSALSDEDTADLLNWIARNLSDLKVQRRFTEYSALEIHRLRGRPLSQVSRIRTRLWKAATSR